MSLPTADYRYHALSATDSIRLLTLSRDESQPHGMLLSLAEAHLSDRPEFVALSYTWRLPEYADARDRSDPGEEGRTFEVACDGRLMRISENLFSFLGSALAVRGAGAKKKTTATTVSSSSSSSSSTGLTSLTAELLNGLPMWIDAFCVDQGNNSERQHQVLLMHRIYSSARNVVIWMGPSEPEADFLWIHDRFIPRLARLTREKPEFVAQHLKKDPLCLSAEVALEIGLDTCSRWTTAWPLLVRFFRRRRWFDRGWVVQEVTMADPARALVLCGTTALSWRRLAALSQFLHQSNWGVLLTRHLVYPLVAAARSGFPLSSTLDFSISAEVLLGARANTQERLLDIGDKIRQISLIRPVLTNTAGRTSVVDSAGKWHRDAETAWFMCASLLVNLLRSSQLGDNRDHLYGCLALSSRKRDGTKLQGAALLGAGLFHASSPTSFMG
ncbi:heterokaryon incompatibility protein [Colletotrichum graminicola M1.001]|uniref:Heterokaryon incompatibility protein n=1 Tax=Colletotrichum graminicola (strain M1.001 / M2 / FGSC 10212) TaxID=645133 RepID=E3Q7F2_COLGM|nr:heterokaryon incompatibility protein [Colletotrichum graminicola M1.001]EFQ26790.1 heterokaryon incompatibility protein [Colletotrichum graminicola M1.001]